MFVQLSTEVTVLADIKHNLESHLRTEEGKNHASETINLNAQFLSIKHLNIQYTTTETKRYPFSLETNDTFLNMTVYSLLTHVPSGKIRSGFESGSSICFFNL